MLESLKSSYKPLLKIFIISIIVLIGIIIWALLDMGPGVMISRMFISEVNYDYNTSLIEEDDRYIIKKIPINNQSADYMRLRALAYHYRDYQYLLDMHVPYYFTIDERRLFRDIMRDITWDSGFGYLHTRHQRRDLSVISDNVLNHLNYLGYTVDGNIISWEE